MTTRHFLAGSLALAALTAGCQSRTAHQQKFSFGMDAPQCESTKVTVRFVNQPGVQLVSDTIAQSTSAPCFQPCSQPCAAEKPCNQPCDSHCTCHNSWHLGWSCGTNLTQFFSDFFSCKQSSSQPCEACTGCNQSHVADGIPPSSFDTVSLCSTGGFAGATDKAPQHAVLWGNGYNGNDVTRYPTSLTPGAYTFAYFDPDRAAAYQGWISVNNGGDDVLSALTQWRDTVHNQEEWLAFDYKVNGKFASNDPGYFNRFQDRLAGLRRLEAKINAAIAAEQQDRQLMCQYANNYLGNTQVVLMPGGSGNYGFPATLPVFQPTDLSAVQGGQPVTKVILAGDFTRAMEKLDRLNDLQSEMRRCRAVLNEEIMRLDNRRSYFRLTSHLYNQDFNFINNEKQVQKAGAMLASIDRQIAQNRRHAHAVLAVVGLFAPEEADLAFQREQTEIRGERAVFVERLNQVEQQFSDASTWSEKRVALERQRQFLNGQIAECDAQLDQCENASDAVAQLRQNAGVIYRNGPATVLAASFVTDSMPARLANAIEQEATMTIRLHSAEGIRPSPRHLTEGGMFGEQMFLLTNDQPSEQPSVYQNGTWGALDADQPTLIEWSNTQRNYGIQNQNQHQNPDCLHPNND